MKVFKVIYNGTINYDKGGIESVKFYSLEEVHKMLNKNPGEFKPDFKTVFKRFFGLKKSFY